MPDQSVYGAPFQAEADSQGRVEGISLRTVRGDPEGIWGTSMEGTESHTKSIGYFKLASNTPPTPTPGGSAATCDTTGTHDGSAKPSSGHVGDTIMIYATGFRPGEDVSYWFPLPDGMVAGTPAPVSGGVNPDGSIGPLRFTIGPGDVELGTGKWAITFEGADSHHQAVIYFCVFP
jgi:hypothetical protein